MRTLIVATQIQLPGRHGGSTHVGELVEHLRDNGPVLMLGQRGSTAPDVVGIGLRARLPGLAQQAIALGLLPRALAHAQKFKPDVIYERGSSYGLGALLSVALGVPLLCMVLDEHYSPLSLRRAHTLISTTEVTVPKAYRHKFVQVSWGANTKRFHDAVKPVSASELPPHAGVNVGYVGSFKRWHGLNDLIAAAQRLPQSVRFVLVGDGPERVQLEQAVNAAGLASRFVFSGAVDYERVPSWIAAMDICVAPFHPSQHVASKGDFLLDPLKVFEYLAMGKPTITVQSANIERLFQNSEHALLVAPGDVAALCAAIEQLIDNPEHAQTLGQRGRELVLAKHTWAAHAEHLRMLFQRMIDQSKPPAAQPSATQS